MKKNYEDLVFEVVGVDVADVITTSIVVGGDGDNEGPSPFGSSPYTF